MVTLKGRFSLVRVATNPCSIGSNEIISIVKKRAEWISMIHLNLLESMRLILVVLPPLARRVD